MTKNTLDQKKLPEVSYSSILESISDGVFTVDSNWKITSFNHAAEMITAIPRAEALGNFCSDVFRSSLCENHCPLRKTLEDKKPVINKSCYIISAKGEKIPVSVSTAVLRDKNGNICGGAETFRDLREIQILRQELSMKYRIGDLISRSSAMKEVFQIIPVVADSNSTLLLQGETGTGKELLAKAVHNMSPRKNEPFISINCAALPDTLLESELFGYKKGAFTGADQDKPGRFTLADKGTLFLDEIGDISPALQAKLLRVMNDRSFQPLGSVKSEFTSARFITATNKDLLELVKNNLFREDLFYRINVINIKLPPLRERKEDIPLLVEHFISRFNKLQNKNIASVTPSAMNALMAHNWQGNIRELENVVERAFVLCRTDEIDISHLPEQFDCHNTDQNIDSIKALNQINEKQLIIASLTKNDFNRNAAARELGIHKTTLYRKIKNLNISLPNSRHKPPR
jgi:PAS domain S-box-containing protein